jgi:predicted amidophosphoribosyltransferase
MNWLYPPKCMACAALLPLNDAYRCAIWLCGECEALLVPLPGMNGGEGCFAAECSGCPQTCEPSTPPHAVPNYSAFAYEGILRDIIRDVKFRHKKNHARALGRLWSLWIQNNLICKSEDAPGPREEAEDCNERICEVPRSALARWFSVPPAEQGTAQRVQLPLLNLGRRGLHPSSRSVA